MKNLIFPVAAAAAALVPTAASAQALPAAVVAVVDIDQVTTQCTACKTAQAAMKSKYETLQSRERALAAPLETEQKSLQAAVDALKGQEPDAALKQRAQAFQSKYEQAQQEAARARAQFQADSQYVQKQVADKLGPIYQQVMQRRGANVLLEAGATLAAASSIDVTNDVLAGLNAALPSISTNAPAAQQKPQGR